VSTPLEFRRGYSHDRQDDNRATVDGHSSGGFGM